MEHWERIPEFPRYSVSDAGRVRNDHTGRIMALETNQQDVVFVGLMGEDGLQKKRSVSLLVANAFIPRPSEPFDTPICKNGDRFNVTVGNLCWRPRWFAAKYHRQFTHRFHSPLNVPIREIKTRHVFPNSLECAKWYGLLEHDLVLSILNRTFVWPTYQEFELVE